MKSIMKSGVSPNSTGVRSFPFHIVSATSLPRAVMPPICSPAILANFSHRRMPREGNQLGFGIVQ